MKHYLTPLARLSVPIALVAMLAACNNKQTETVNGGYADPMEKELANAAPVELPPALKASKTYRCKDNSLVFVDFMADDLTAQIRTEKTGPVTRLKAATVGEAFTSEDGATKVEGSGGTVTVTAGGKGAQSCKG